MNSHRSWGGPPESPPYVEHYRFGCRFLRMTHETVPGGSVVCAYRGANMKNGEVSEFTYIKFDTGIRDPSDPHRSVAYLITGDGKPESIDTNAPALGNQPGPSRWLTRPWDVDGFVPAELPHPPRHWLDEQTWTVPAGDYEPNVWHKQATEYTQVRRSASEFLIGAHVRGVAESEIAYFVTFDRDDIAPGMVEELRMRWNARCQDFQLVRFGRWA
jgi:hypothetical protein